MFAGIAGRYDVANHLLSGGIDFYWRRVLTRMVQQRAPKDIADLATGSGDVAFKLRDRMGTTVPVTGLDFCEHGINPGHHLDYQFREELHFDAEKGKAAPLLHAHPPATPFGYACMREKLSA